MAVPRQSPYLRSNFLVQIDGLQPSAFSVATPPGGTAAVVRYLHGGSGNAAVPLPGRVTLEPVTLRRGFDGDLEVYSWWRSVQEGNPGWRRDMAIILMDEQQQPVAQWTLYRAFPFAHSFEPLEAGSSEVVMEVVTIVYESYLLE